MLSVKVYGEGWQPQRMSLNVPRKEKWLVLPTKRQGAVARANSASIHVGILVISEATERHFWMSCSIVLHSGSLGAGKCSKSFTRGIQQPKAPSCPLPLSCSRLRTRSGCESVRGNWALHCHKKSKKN